MYMNVFSVRVRLDSLSTTMNMFGQTMAATSKAVAGFQGMMGLVDDEIGDVLSIALNDREIDVLEARESSVNRAEIERYLEFFVTEPERELYRLDMRYIPMNRPFPGHSALFARVTTGWVRPADVARTLALSRDSLVYAAILERGCAGFLLGSVPEDGKIFGVSMWQSLEHMLLSEGEEGYYHREMANFQSVLVQPTIRRTYTVFDRTFAD